jgi:cob(I)alamin adenosyltransferase
MDTSAGVAPRFKRRIRMKDQVPYSAAALREDLHRIRIAWSEFQEVRDRDAVYAYLDAVFQLVLWWTAEGRAVKRARWALQLCGVDLPTSHEPFAAIILCTSDPAKVDKRTRSKWSRVLRYVAAYKDHTEPLAEFIQRKGGLNACAARFARCLGRRSQHNDVERAWA